ncbi:MAG: PVC-type heme-binding CxxCH protein, partial [Verrucomicrobiota bacterium]
MNLLENRQLFRLPRCFIAAIFLPVQLFAAVMPTAPDGFLIEKVASEPGVRFPMFATFDDRGRLFVAESSGLDLYAELSAQTRKCRVRLLEDRDGDGRFESSRVFADRLVFPMGIAWREDKLYVADPPDLVCFSDSNGDGQADERQVVLTGFGHKDNGSLHGLVFGPDGWLYMTMGEPDGYRLARGDGSFLEGESGALIRCRPDGSQPEVVSRGFVNLIEVVFTPAGDILGTDNWFQWPSGGVRDALIHLQEGGLYPLKLEDKGTPMPMTGVTLPSLALFPAVALSGLVLYEGASFPPEMHGNLFSAQHNSRKVQRHKLERDGASFRVATHEFVASDDPDFHPADVLEDGDGSLLIVDTGGWYVQHCPTGKIRASHAPGGIYRVRFAGATRVADPWGATIDWNELRPAELFERLQDSRPAVRAKAKETIVKRGLQPTSEMRTWFAASKLPTARQQLLWTLANSDSNPSLEFLRAALRDDDMDIVQTAARIVGRVQDRNSAPELERLLRIGEPRLKLAAAESLARAGRPESLPVIWSALASGVEAGDRILEHALAHAAFWLADKPALLQALDHPSARVQRAALVLLDLPPHRALRLEHVVDRLNAADADLKAAVLARLQKHSDWAGAARSYLASQWNNSDEPLRDPMALRELILSFQSDSGVQELIAQILAQPTLAAARSAPLLEIVASMNPRSINGPLADALEHWLKKGASASRLQAIRAAAKYESNRFDTALREISDDSGAGMDLRLEALGARLARVPALRESDLQLLKANLQNSSDPMNRLRVAHVLQRATLTSAQWEALAPHLSEPQWVAPGTVLAALARGQALANRALVDYFIRSL